LQARLQGQGSHRRHHEHVQQQPDRNRLEVRNADRDLGNIVGETLLKRCTANKEKVKIVPAQLVASYMSDNLDRRSLSMMTSASASRPIT